MRARKISSCLAAGFVLAASLVGGGAAAQQGTAPRPANIDRNGVLILIRTTLIALQQANETGNYTVLRDLAAPQFQQANNAARLSEIFANLRARKLDLSGVTVLDPQLTLLPQIEANGMMHMSGFFPSVPVQINFELLYAPVEGRWRPFGISVQLGSSSPVAPPPPEPPKVKADPIPLAVNKPKKRGGRTKAADEAVKPSEDAHP